VRDLIAAVGTLPPTAVPSDRDAYVARVDQVCVAVADCLLAMRPAQTKPA
jgi:hypothetical protein